MTAPMMAIDAAKGLGDMLVKAAEAPVFETWVQPGKYKVNKKTREKVFVPNPTYPRGIHVVMPAWFVATVGFGVAVVLMGGIGKVLSGLGLSKKEKEDWDQWRDVAMKSMPIFAIADTIKEHGWPSWPGK